MVRLKGRPKTLRLEVFSVKDLIGSMRRFVRRWGWFLTVGGSVKWGRGSVSVRHRWTVEGSLAVSAGQRC